MFTSFFAAATSSKSAIFVSAAATSWMSRAMFHSVDSSTETASCKSAEYPTPPEWSDSGISRETIRSGSNWGIPWDTEWDTVKPSQGASKNVKRQIILIRHGQYQNEGHGNVDSDRVLTDTGVLQAQLTGNYLRKALLQADDQSASELFAARSVKSFTSSNMTRAMQTADHIITNYDEGMKKWWAIDACLAERFPCNPQPPYPKNAKPDCHKIVEGAFKKFIHRPKAGNTENSIEVVVCHANIIRYFLCRSLQLPPEAWLRLSLPHCSLTSVTIRGNGNVSVNQVGSVAHLPTHLQTLSNVQ